MTIRNTLTQVLTLGLALTLPTSTNAAGYAVVRNLCKYPVSILSISGIAPGSPQPTTLAPGSNYTEAFKPASHKGGISLKLRPKLDAKASLGISVLSPALVASVAETIFAYTYDDVAATVWYDLSSVMGDPFAGAGATVLSVVPSLTECGPIVWPGAKNPGGSHVSSCASKTDLTIFLCETTGAAADIVAPLLVTGGKLPF